MHRQTDRQTDRHIHPPPCNVSVAVATQRDIALQYSLQEHEPTHLFLMQTYICPYIRTLSHAHSHRHTCTHTHTSSWQFFKVATSIASIQTMSLPNNKTHYKATETTASTTPGIYQVRILTIGADVSAIAYIASVLRFTHTKLLTALATEVLKHHPLLQKP